MILIVYHVKYVLVVVAFINHALLILSFVFCLKIYLSNTFPSVHNEGAIFLRLYAESPP